MFISYFILCFFYFFTHSKASDVRYQDSLNLLRCSIWDHNCQKETAQMALPLLAQGLPDLGTRRLDPLREPFVEIKHDGLKNDLNHFEMSGFANSIVNKASFDIISKTYRLRFIIPIVKINSTYSASGFMHELPFNGKGDMYVRANEVEIDAIISFDVREDNKKRKFAELTSYFYSYEVLGDGVIVFENVNADAPKLRTAADTALHENFKAITAEYGKPFINPLIEAAFKSLTQFTHSLDLSTFFNDI